MGQSIFLGMWGAAAIATSVGILCYFFDRPAQTVYFLPDFLAAGQTSPGGIHDSAPSFIHAFVISMLLVHAVGRQSLLAIGFSCTVWWSFECLLEAAQHEQLAQWLCNLLPEWIRFFPILDNLSAYAIGGTFDPTDIVFAGIGCLAAFLMSIYLQWSASCA